jgi:Ca2+-binding EF-hand superfamily protein
VRLAAAAALLFASAATLAQDSRAEYLQRFDTDGDGRVSAAEYVAYMSQGFRNMDSNGDGIIDTDELPGGRGRPITLLENQDNLRRQFHKLDRNRDGYLNARELTAPPG